MSFDSPSSSDPARCPNCGAALPEQAPQGLCPKCLFAGLAAPTEDGAGAAQAPSQTPEELAPHFPQLEILECLGRGGMGVVYKARQKSLNRLVALKLLAPERVADAKFAERFTHEAQALAKLSHPHIVAVYDFGHLPAASASQLSTLDPQLPLYFLLMEFVDGVNLRQAMKAGRFTPEQALAIVPPVCEALQYAHEHGIVHRDIKPENLLLDKEGRVKIADFGIAKMLGDESSAGLADSQPAGTPQYMAPEQKAHRATDHRADIYSLGVVLYELLTGELPADKLQPPSRKVQIDVRLDEIVLRALEKTPELRYQTASEFRTHLETVVSTPGESGRVKHPSNAAGEKRSAQPPRLLKAGRGFLFPPDQFTTTAGQFHAYRRNGQLFLDDCQLTHSLEGVNTTIPLLAIRDLSLAPYPRTMAPVSCDLISISYEEDGQRRQALLSPMEGWFGFPSVRNALAAEWFAAIRDAVTLATGHPPASTPREQIRVPHTATFMQMLMRAGPLLALAVVVAAGVLFIVFHSLRTNLALRQENAAIAAAHIAGPEIERVEVGNDNAIVKQRRYDSEGMMITFGPMTNRWTPGGLYLDTMFDITLGWPWLGHGANWVVKTRHGIHANYRLDGPPGPMLGKIVFHPGTPAPAADGSYVIGEFRPDKGESLPIAVRLERDSARTVAPPSLEMDDVATAKIKVVTIAGESASITMEEAQGGLVFVVGEGEKARAIVHECERSPAPVVLRVIADDRQGRWWNQVRIVREGEADSTIPVLPDDWLPHGHLAFLPAPVKRGDGSVIIAEIETAPGKAPLAVRAAKPSELNQALYREIPHTRADTEIAISAWIYPLRKDAPAKALTLPVIVARDLVGPSSDAVGVPDLDAKPGKPGSWSRGMASSERIEVTATMAADGVHVAGTLTVPMIDGKFATAAEAFRRNEAESEKDAPRRQLQSEFSATLGLNEALVIPIASEGLFPETLVSCLTALPRPVPRDHWLPPSARSPIQIDGWVLTWPRSEREWFASFFDYKGDPDTIDALLQRRKETSTESLPSEFVGFMSYADLQALLEKFRSHPGVKAIRVEPFSVKETHLRESSPNTTAFTVAGEHGHMEVRFDGKTISPAWTWESPILKYNSPSIGVRSGGCFSALLPSPSDPGEIRMMILRCVNPDGEAGP